MATNGGGPLNFRRGLDELQQGNAQSADSQTQKAQMIGAVGQRYSDSVDRLAHNITSGVQGVIQNVQSSEELRMRRDMQRQQMAANDWRLKKEQELAPLEKQQLQNNVEHSEILVKKSKLDFEHETVDYQQKQEGKQASDRALVDAFNSSGKAKPKGWVSMSTSAQAAYVASQEAESDRKLKRSATVTDIDLKKSEIATSEVRRTDAIMQLTQKAGPEAVMAMVKNPDGVVTKDIPPEQLKRTQEKWSEYNKSAQAYGKGQQLTARMFQIAGLETTGKNGVPTEDDMERHAEQMAGLFGTFGKATGNPKQKELDGLMVELMSQQAEAGKWRIQSDSDVNIAYQRMGSKPGAPDFNQGKFFETLASVMAESQNTKAYFRTSNARANETREQLKRDIVANDGFLGIPMKEKADALYMQQPYSMRNPESSSYIPPDEFSKKSTQEMYNSTFGFNADKGEPNLAAPLHWQQQQQMDLMLRDPLQSAKLIEQTRAQTSKPFTFTDASNQAIADNVYAYRKNAVNIVSSPAAKAGIDPTTKALPTTKVGEQVDTSRGNPNAPVIFNQALFGEAPGFAVVPQPSGKAAAGATPVGKTAGKYQAGVQKKFDLHPTWRDDVLGAFK